MTFFTCIFRTAAELHRIPRKVDTFSSIEATNSCTPYVIVQRDERDGLAGRDGLPGRNGLPGVAGEKGDPGLPQGKN